MSLALSLVVGDGVNISPAILGKTSKCESAAEGKEEKEGEEEEGDSIVVLTHLARAKTRQAHPASRHKNSRQGQVHICGRCVDFAFAAILQFRREHPILCGITWWPHNWPEYVRIDKPSGCGRQHQGAEPREPPTTMLGGVVRHDHMIAAAVTHGEIGDHYAAHFGTAPRYVCENAAVVRMVRSRGANIARAHHLRTRGW